MFEIKGEDRFTGTTQVLFPAKFGSEEAAQAFIDCHIIPDAFERVWIDVACDKACEPVG